MTNLWVNAQDSLAAGEKLLFAVEHGDLEELRTIFADGAVVWHNTDDRLTSVEQSIKNLRAIKDAALEFKYVDVRREPTPAGFVQQHVLYMRLKDGQEIHDRVCCVCRVENGRISHMDAYHDSAAAPRLPGRKAGKDWRHED